jgi:hypothetical protein
VSRGAQNIAVRLGIYQTAQQDRVNFNLAYIGSDFSYPHNEKFDPEYMKRLFDYASATEATTMRGQCP